MLANFVFKIGNISFISSINFNITSEMIILYIIQVNKPFLLYFADIDKWGVFFNNFTNQVIQFNNSHLIIY